MGSRAFSGVPHGCSGAVAADILTAPWQPGSEALLARRNSANTSERDTRVMGDGQEALAARYGGLVPEAAVTLNETMQLLLRHRSVRSYDPARRIPDGLLTALIAAGQSGATSSNMQTASVVVVEDPERLDRLAQIATQDFVADASAVLCFVTDLSRPARVGELTGVDLFALRKLSTFVTSANDCAIFAQGVVVGAESAGLGTCYIGNLRNDTRAVAELLQLPPQAAVIFGLCLGYEKAPVTGVRPRLPQNIVVHREVYSVRSEPDLLRDYDEAFRAHEVSQGRPARTWTQRHADRLASSDYLGESVRMRDILAELGFHLE